MVLIFAHEDCDELPKTCFESYRGACFFSGYHLVSPRSLGMVRRQRPFHLYHANHVLSFPKGATQRLLLSFVDPNE